ncbi:hypothetical protein JIG36_27985 [Actinoplanes sp. LDG1-06]|uniref:STAS domain-containing protein n=1 Tax=Paractinoplanes ovalisporus TaxID=2810368 RepID=A0ABS2AJK0_9ACTN|nr:hypothetical protein [Actinoplanes ovalisporus]MBM2619399.1 hypothetical protein [Actinoplanes ovalisporus]
MIWTNEKIAVSGSIDQANAGPVADRLCAAIIGAITIVDLGRVTFFSAAGLHMIESVAAAARAADAIAQVTCSGPVWQVLDLCEATDLPGLVLDRSPRTAAETDGTEP